MKDFWKHAVRETLLGAIAATIFSLFSVALFAVFVRAYAPSEIGIAVGNKVILSLCAFLAALLFVKKDRALFKGAAAGALFLLISTLIFGLIGGFRFSALWLVDLLLSVLFGGFGALLGAKLRKD